MNNLDSILTKVKQLNPEVIMIINSQIDNSIQMWADVIESKGYLILLTNQDNVDWDMFLTNSFVYLLEADLVYSSSMEDIELFLDKIQHKIDFLFIANSKNEELNFKNYFKFVRLGGLVWYK